MTVTDNTIIDLERSIAELVSERAELITKDKTIDLKIAVLNNRVRAAGRHLPPDEYREICQEQLVLKNEKLAGVTKISELKRNIQKRHLMIDEVKSHMKRNGLNPAGSTKESLTLLRDKYMAFSSDTTRISSMRAMASQVSEELELIIKTL